MTAMWFFNESGNKFLKHNLSFRSRALTVTYFACYFFSGSLINKKNNFLDEHSWTNLTSLNRLPFHFEKLLFLKKIKIFLYNSIFLIFKTISIKVSCKCLFFLENLLLIAWLHMKIPYFRCATRKPSVRSAKKGFFCSYECCDFNNNARCFGIIVRRLQ